MNIVWTNDICLHSICNLPVSITINGCWGEIVFGDDGTLFCEDRCQSIWGPSFISGLEALSVQGAIDNLYLSTAQGDALNSIAGTMDSAIDTLKKVNKEKDDIIKVINQTVDHNGNIIELIVRKPRSEDERSEINERERDSKSRAIRREKNKGHSEIEREIRGIELCKASS